MRIAFILVIAVLFASCSSKTAVYDIDVECWRGFGALQIDSNSGDDQTTKTFQCAGPEWFEIQCDSKTIQLVDDAYLCSTHDGKSVKIKKTTPKIN